MHALAGACAASNVRYGAANKPSYIKFITMVKQRKGAQARKSNDALTGDRKWQR